MTRDVPSSPWLFLHAGALGDLVLGLQVALRIHAVRRGGGLDVLSRADPGDLSRASPRISRRSLDAVGSHWLYADGVTESPIAELLRGRRVLSALSGADDLIHARIAQVAAEVFSFDPRPRADHAGHITSQWEAVLRRQRLTVDSCVRRRAAHRAIALDDATREAGRRIFARRGVAPPCAVLHPGSGDLAKNWSAAGFRAVAGRLRSAGLTPVVVVGEAECDRWPAAALREFATECALLERPAPVELLAILATADVFVGNDSGVTHLAALAGTPVVALFGPTDPRRWAPLGPTVQVVQGDPQAVEWGLSAEKIAGAAVQIVRRERPD